MMPRGLPIAQVESSLEGDPKFLRLRMAHPERYYAALGTYMSITLRAWATGSREPDPDALALMDPGILGSLRDRGLLDDSSAIPEHVFAKWTGAVLESRQARAEQLASIASQGGKARARGPRDAAGRLLSPAVTAGHPAVTAGHPAVSPLLSSPLVELFSAPAREAPLPGWAYLYPVVVELTGKHVAHGKFASDLCDLAAQAGPEIVVAAMRAVAEGMAPVRPDIRALAFGVNDALRRPPPGRQIASVVQDEQERVATARKAAERTQARADRQRRALELSGLLEEHDDA